MTRSLRRRLGLEPWGFSQPPAEGEEREENDDEMEEVLVKKEEPEWHTYEENPADEEHAEPGSDGYRGLGEMWR